MKANGKNLMMFSYLIQGTMDWKPEICFMSIESRKKMQEFINFVQGHTGDNIFNVKEVSPFEYFQARQSKYWKGHEADLDKNAEDCSKQWVEEYDFYVKHKDYDEAALLKMYEDYIEDRISDYIDNQF